MLFFTRLKAKLSKANTLLIVSFIFLSVSFQSCMTHKKSLLFLEKHSTKFQQDSAYSNTYFQYYKLLPGDILSIKIKSIDPSTEQAFSKTNINSTGTSNSKGMLNGYLLDELGFIDMPILGNIHLAGQTLPEAKETILLHMNKYFQKINVTVVLQNYTIDVIGYAGSTKRLTIDAPSINLVSFIALMGDVDLYGDRKRVKLFRQEDGKTKIIMLNLQKLDSIDPKYFHLMPRDVLYFQPDRSLAFKRNLPAVTITISMFLLFFSLYNTFLSGN
jgi:polysaccharide export outer membrane protein